MSQINSKCRKNVLELYNRENRFYDYIELYKNLGANKCLKGKHY